jgi:hypothetical protein
MEDFGRTMLTKGVSRWRLKEFRRDMPAKSAKAVRGEAVYTPQDIEALNAAWNYFQHPCGKPRAFQHAPASDTCFGIR